MPTTMIITNDFPPRIGGIESFVADLCGFLDNDVVVYSSAGPGAGRFDRTLDFEVVRDGPLLLPTPATRRRAVGLLRSRGVSRVVFGAAAPLGLLAPAMRRAGADRILALTHGHETWWASLPGTRQLLRRIADSADEVSTISDYVAGRLRPALSPGAQRKLVRLPPPVDVDLFRPAVGGPEQPPRCVAVGRFVARKGLDTLLRAWRLVLDDWPDGAATPELIMVGDGPQRAALLRMVTDLGLTDAVQFTGALPRSAVVTQLHRATVFALPVRTRLGGLDPEGLGLAGIEAAATGLPVIVGDSGGAPETVDHGRTGFVVDPYDRHGLARRLSRLLVDRQLARRMGAAGRDFVTGRFGAVQARRTLRAALRLP